MIIKDKIYLILNKIINNKKFRIISVFLFVGFVGLIFVRPANAAIQDAIMSGIGILFNALAKLFFNFCKPLMLFFISIMTYTGQFVNSAAINTVWTFIRDLVNMTFIIAMLITAVYKMVGKENKLAAGKFETQIIYILIGAFIVNFSKVICGAFIDLTNLISIIFINSYGDSVANLFNSVFELKDSAGAVSLGLGVTNLVFALALFAYAVTILVYAVVRMVILSITTALSPLYVFSFFFPTKIKELDKLNIKDQFFSFALGGVTVTFFLWISLMILTAGNGYSGNIESALFGTNGAIVANQTTVDISTGPNDTTTPLNAGDLILKIVSVVILLIAQKSAVAAAKTAGFGLGKITEKVMDKATKVGMTPLNFAKGLGKDTLNIAKQFGSKTMDSTTGGISKWMNSSENILAKGANKAMQAADNLREGKENREKYLTDRQTLKDKSTTLKGAREWRTFKQNQAGMTGEKLREGVASIGAAKDRFDMNKDVSREVQDYKDNRDNFITDEVLENLDRDLKPEKDEKDFSIENENENFVKSLLNAKTDEKDENGDRKLLLNEDQRKEIENESDMNIKIQKAKGIYEQLTTANNGGGKETVDKSVKDELAYQYDWYKKDFDIKNRDRHEVADGIRASREGGDMESANEKAKDIYKNSKVYGVDSTSIDREYNKGLDDVRGKKIEKGSKVDSLNRQKEYIQSQIDSGNGRYTKKDIEVIDEKVKLEKKKELSKKADEKRTTTRDLLKQKRANPEIIKELEERKNKFEDMGGENALKELETKSKSAESIVEDSNLLNAQTEGGEVQSLLGLDGIDFDEKLKGINAKGEKINPRLAAWIKDKNEEAKTNGETLTLDSLKNFRKDETENAKTIIGRTKIMKGLELKPNEQELLDVNYEKLQKARKGFADSKKAVVGQKTEIDTSREKAAGAYKAPESDDWKKIKELQDEDKEKYVDEETNKFNADLIDFTRHFNVKDLKNGKFNLAGASMSNFIADVGLKLKEGKNLTDLEKRALNDKGVQENMMKFISGKDNTFKKEWNSQIEKNENSDFRNINSNFTAKIIDEKVLPKTVDDRKTEQSRYSIENIKRRSVEYLSSNLKKTKNGKVDEVAISKVLDDKFGGLNLSDNPEMFQEILEEAEKNNASVENIRKYKPLSDNSDNPESIALDVEALKNMYSTSRKFSYEDEATEAGYTESGDIERYANTLAYKDVMKKFFGDKAKKGKLGELIKKEMRNNPTLDEGEAFAEVMKRLATAGTGGTAGGGPDDTDKDDSGGAGAKTAGAGAGRYNPLDDEDFRDQMEIRDEENDYHGYNNKSQEEMRDNWRGDGVHHDITDDIVDYDDVPKRPTSGPKDNGSTRPDDTSTNDSSKSSTNDSSKSSTNDSSKSSTNDSSKSSTQQNDNLNGSSTNPADLGGPKIDTDQFISKLQEKQKENLRIASRMNNYTSTAKQQGIPAQERKAFIENLAYNEAFEEIKTDSSVAIPKDLISSVESKGNNEIEKGNAVAQFIAQRLSGSSKTVKKDKDVSDATFVNPADTARTIEETASRQEYIGKTYDVLDKNGQERMLRDAMVSLESVIKDSGGKILSSNINNLIEKLSISAASSIYIKDLIEELKKINSSVVEPTTIKKVSDTVAANNPVSNLISEIKTSSNNILGRVDSMKDQLSSIFSTNNASIPSAIQKFETAINAFNNASTSGDNILMSQTLSEMSNSIKELIAELSSRSTNNEDVKNAISELQKLNSSITEAVAGKSGSSSIEKDSSSIITTIQKLFGNTSSELEAIKKEVSLMSSVKNNDFSRAVEKLGLVANGFEAAIKSGNNDSIKQTLVDISHLSSEIGSINTKLINQEKVADKIIETIVKGSNGNNEIISRMDRINNIVSNGGDNKSKILFNDLSKKIDDYKFAINNGSNDKKAGLDLSTKSISQLRNLLEGILGGNGKSGGKLEQIAVDISKSLADNTKLSEVVGSVNNLSKKSDTSEIAKIILTSIVSRINEVSTLENLLGKIDKTQISLLDIVKNRKDALDINKF